MLPKLVWPWNTLSTGHLFLWGICVPITPRNSLKNSELKIIIPSGTVIHTYNPSYLAGKDQEDLCSRPVQAKLARPFLNHKPGMVTCSCDSSYVGDISKRHDPDQLGQKCKTLFKK
jgi:hypothetical protein